MKCKLLMALVCVLALCWLCVGALAVDEPSESGKPIDIFDSAEVDWEGNPITVQIYPSYSGRVTFRDGNPPTCTAIAATNYVFAGYRVCDLNDPISADTSDSYSQFGTAVESIGTMPNMEHPIFTAIFERVNVAVSPVGAGSASYTALDDFKGFVAEPNEGWRFFGWKYAADAWIEPAEYNSTDTMWEMSNPRRTGTYTAYFVKMAEYMEGHIGEEFDGIVSGLTNFGLFVELENLIEGLVHISTLKGDYYIYNKDIMAIVGESHKKMYRLGDKVRIKVIAANKQNKTIDFEIVGERKDGDKQQESEI